MAFLPMKDFPENTILECLEGNGTIVKMVYVTGTDWASLWHYAEGAKIGQMARWPIGWRLLENDEE